jgi:single-strand DNA-binding protein
MGRSLNRVELIGNLGRDPECKHTHDGRMIANLSVATSESWTDKQTGEKRERSEWHRVVIFNENLAKIAAQYLRKGAKVFVEGQLQTRKWQDKEGQDRYTTEVVLQGFQAQLIMLGDRAGSGEVREYGGEPRRQSSQPAQQKPRDDFSDEIPFESGAVN